MTLATLDCSLPGSSATGIFQAKTLEWVAISFSRGFSRPQDQAQVCLYQLSYKESSLNEDEMRPIKIKVDSLLHYQFRCYFIPKQPHRHTQNNI